MGIERLLELMAIVFAVQVVGWVTYGSFVAIKSLITGVPL